MVARLRLFRKFARLGKHRDNHAAYAACMKITLIALGVSDLSKSIAFYRDKAGFDLQNQFDSLAFFSAGPVMLMLNAGLKRPNGPLAGAMEIVVGAESVLGSHQLLLDRGCSFINEPREVTPGSWAVTFSDPDGHWLTLFGPK